MGSELARAVDAAVRDAAERAARLVAEELLGRTGESAPRWLDSKRAAAHLGITPHALRHHVRRQAIPFSQDGPGAKLWFNTGDLDAWRRDQGHDARR